MNREPHSAQEEEKKKPITRSVFLEDLDEFAIRLPGERSRFEKTSWPPNQKDDKGKGKDGLNHFLEWINIEGTPRMEQLEDFRKELHHHEHSSDPQDLIFQMQLKIVDKILERIKKSESKSSQPVKGESVSDRLFPDTRVGRMAKEKMNQVGLTIKNLLKQIHDAIMYIVNFGSSKRRKTDPVPAYHSPTAAPPESSEAQPRSPPSVSPNSAEQAEMEMAYASGATPTSAVGSSQEAVHAEIAQAVEVPKNLAGVPALADIPSMPSDKPLTEPTMSPEIAALAAAAKVPTSAEQPSLATVGTDNVVAFDPDKKKISTPATKANPSIATAISPNENSSEAPMAKAA